ncbi:hypothetical protein CAOG_05580 [Capsaspora owczarzaki ATCC 30864]|uniref:Uncharacterized protein n=1 Tax=Capsaspora owczarzaki (strain ATCC 30864) TaxID=595528 RepID=A0A0D2WTQ8_CAPO3|nr:hypothetical protein CAOG_05580 [Capsaspora owczarzaki ATCC 30864]KJE95088.1 hypothetical protein CAOG_005580 [Capsaspora owczarzaki ATCC 30864]|eukprot:XP_004346253.1 hypothetical protein CAOG_05580 [Capsaspora owczarzaki ATCC 30864]
MGIWVSFTHVRGISTTLANLPKRHQTDIYRRDNLSLTGTSLVCYPMKYGALRKGKERDELQVLVGYEARSEDLTKVDSDLPPMIVRSEFPLTEADWIKFAEHLPEYLHEERESFADYFLFQFR